MADQTATPATPDIFKDSTTQTTQDDKQHDMNAVKRGPADTIRDGALKATIWRNEGRNGAFHNTTITKTYDGSDGQPRDGHSFSRVDLLKMGGLASLAAARVRELDQDNPRQSTPLHDGAASKQTGNSEDGTAAKAQFRTERSQQEPAPQKGRDR